VSWWTGDGNALDLAGVNNGTLQGGATASGVGEVGAAFTFDGTNNYVSIPDSASLRPSVFTVECWVRFNNLNSAGNSQAGQQYIVFKQNTRTANFEGIYLAKERRTSSDIFVFGVSSSGGAGVEVDSTTPGITWPPFVGPISSSFTSTACLLGRPVSRSPKITGHCQCSSVRRANRIGTAS
jgi:hypothetical protein